MTWKDQDDLTQFACSFCCQHAYDNVAKAEKTCLIASMNRRCQFHCSAKEKVLSTGLEWFWFTDSVPGSEAHDLYLQSSSSFNSSS